MKKIWKVVFLAAVILCAAGVVCIGVSYFIGGSVDELYQNKAAHPILEILTPENIVSSITAFFGA
ncbi:MAG: hypothetical protein VB064_13820 [Oscillospiraceae bacterium]|nr:hypothetical protein [Oscillospiraceae bacterium]